MILSVSHRYHVGIASAFLAGFGTMATADDCVKIYDDVMFCGDPAIWQPLDAPEGTADATYAGPLDVLAQVFVDSPGSNDGVTIDGYLAQILADDRLPLSGATIKVVAHTVDTVDGQAGRSLILDVDKEWRRATFMVTVLVLPEQTLRILTIASPGGAYAPKAEVHAAFVAAIRIGSTDG
jgi:hypothetical protein